MDLPRNNFATSKTFASGTRSSISLANVSPQAIHFAFAESGLRLKNQIHGDLSFSFFRELFFTQFSSL